jgi:hypothetical protein
MGDSFSQRHGYGQRREIAVREDAPEALRAGLLTVLRGIGFSYNEVRAVICPVLRTFPDPANWAEIPNVRDEVTGLLQSCDWYRVYDIIEAVYTYFRDAEPRERFTVGINEIFEQEGIGWQLVDGRIATRGSEEFEHGVNQAVAALNEAQYQTPRTELEEARRDLSRRPDPDITGTIQHCMASLECTARIIANDPRATLGEIVGRHGAELGIPRPLDDAIQRVWGYASEMARHVREGRTPARDEAELLLGLSASLITYLLRRGGGFN